MSIGDRR